MVLQRTEMPFLFCNILYAVSYKHIKQLTKKKTVSDLLGPVTTTFPQYYFIGFEKKKKVLEFCYPFHFTVLYEINI